jgi:hypothetical protein
MKKNILQRLLLIFFLCMLGFPAPVQAQSPISLAAVEVALWPEFDQPTMLVIYRITLSSQVSLPVEMRLNIPTTAGAPHAVAVKQPDGSLINLPFEQQGQSGGWTQLVFAATAPELQIEYYDPGLIKNDATRRFEYSWPGDYAVEAFNIEVQQPIGATSMRFTPAIMGASVSGMDGLAYFSQQVGALTAGQSFRIAIEYEKASDELSAGSMRVDPGGPLGETASGRSTLMNTLPWALGIVGVLLIGGGAFWYWRAGQKTAPSRSERRSRPRSTVKKEEPETVGGAIYCHQCGKRAASGDKFCRACGTQLRTG